MEHIKKLFKEITAQGGFFSIILALLLAIALVIGIMLLSGVIFVWGLNLLGFAIPYTLETIFGGFVIIACLRSSSSSKE